MKAKCIFNSSWPARWGACATTFYPVILFTASREDALAQNTVAHEYVHVLQIRQLGWLRFYLSYLWQYVRKGYAGISYEQEAAAKQDTQPVTLLPGDYL